LPPLSSNFATAVLRAARSSQNGAGGSLRACAIGQGQPAPSAISHVDAVGMCSLSREWGPRLFPPWFQDFQSAFVGVPLAQTRDGLRTGSPLNDAPDPELNAWRKIAGRRVTAASRFFFYFFSVFAVLVGGETSTLICGCGSFTAWRPFHGV
jgi:hypothetical protein